MEGETPLKDSGSPSQEAFVDEGADGSSDVEALKSLYRNEKCAPDILPFQHFLVERIQEQVLLMEDNIAAFARESSDELMLSLYRMDLNRTLFLLRVYLRTRLSKIEKHAIHIVKTPELWQRLSELEQEYAQSYTDNLAKHLENSVLSKLPPEYQSMLKQASSCTEDNMIPEPQMDSFVFCRSRGPIGSLQLDDKGEETVDLMAADLYILRYRPVRELLEMRRIDLI